MLDSQLLTACKTKFDYITKNEPELLTKTLPPEIINIIENDEHIRNCILIANSDLNRMFMSLSYAQFLGKVEFVDQNILFIHAFKTI